MDVSNLATVDDARTRRLKVIEAVASMGMTAAQAAAYAGLKKSTVTELLKDPRVKKYIQDLQEAHAARLNIRREQVIEGILEAIEHAKLTNEPATQIRGWEAISKMQGYNAAERVIHDIPEETKKMMETFRGMDDQQIAKLADMDDVVELKPGVDYQEVSDE